jgi:dihydrofolate reductase
MEAPGGEPTHRHTGWARLFMGQEQQAFKSQEVFDAECQLVGRVTYESFAGAWPSYEGPMADRMNAMPKYVAVR